MHPNPKAPLDLSEVLAAYNTSEKRILFLDYDGTLAPIVSDPDTAMPSDIVRDILKALCADARNFVYIISGRDRQCLQKWLGRLGVGFSAEHGSFFLPMPREYRKSLDSSGNDKFPWEDASAEMDFSWKAEVLSLMKEYCAKCPGSKIEEKEYTMVWHYRNAETPPSDKLVDDLFHSLQEMENGKHGKRFQTITGSKNVEVRPAGINKGVVVKKILDNPQHANADFVLCAGDDTTDEDMFPPLNSEKDIKHVFTIRVGNVPTTARSHVEKQEDIVQLLGALAKSSNAN